MGKRKNEGDYTPTRSKIISDTDLWKAFIENNQNTHATAKAIGCSQSGISVRLQRIRLGCGSINPTIFEPSVEAKRNRFQELLDNASVKPESLGHIQDATLTEWGGGIKNKEGEWEEHGLYSKKLRFVPNTPKFPLIQPATPVPIVHIDVPRILHPVKHAIVISDAQINYLRDARLHTFTPSHDPPALEVTRQIIADVAPNRGAFIGDWMDWEVFSRYAKHPEAEGATQISVQAGYEWKGRHIAAAPSDCAWQEADSNHSIRLPKFIQEHNREGMNLQRAKRFGEIGEEWPVFSEQFLLRYDELGIHMVGRYPGGEFELIPGLWCGHAPHKPGEFAVSFIHGHLHKLTITSNVIFCPERRSMMMYDCGCLCSVDKNPNERSLHALRVGSDRGRTNWLQGIAVVEYIESKAPIWQHHVQLVHIEAGKALFSGRVYDGSNVFETWLPTSGIV